jgi:hypothetical protein
MGNIQSHNNSTQRRQDIGRIRSIQLTNRSTISRWVRWLMGLMVYSDEGFWTAIGTTPCKSSSGSYQSTAW